MSYRVNVILSLLIVLFIVSCYTLGLIQIVESVHEMIIKLWKKIFKKDHHG